MINFNIRSLLFSAKHVRQATQRAMSLTMNKAPQSFGLGNASTPSHWLSKIVLKPSVTNPFDNLRSYPVNRYNRDGFDFGLIADWHRLERSGYTHFIKTGFTSEAYPFLVEIANQMGLTDRLSVTKFHETGDGFINDIYVFAYDEESLAAFIQQVHANYIAITDCIYETRAQQKRQQQLNDDRAESRQETGSRIDTDLLYQRFLDCCFEKTKSKLPWIAGRKNWLEHTLDIAAKDNRYFRHAMSQTMRELCDLFESLAELAKFPTVNNTSDIEFSFITDTEKVDQEATYHLRGLLYSLAPKGINLVCYVDIPEHRQFQSKLSISGESALVAQFLSDIHRTFITFTQMYAPSSTPTPAQAVAGQDLPHFLSQIQTRTSHSINKGVSLVFFHTVSSKAHAQAILKGIDPRHFNPSSRFGPGFYLATDESTTYEELKHHGKMPEQTVSVAVDPADFRILDLTDPAKANEWGYDPENSHHPHIATQAAQAGFNAIQFSSTKGSGNNLVVIRDYEKLNAIVATDVPKNELIPVELRQRRKPK